MPAPTQAAGMRLLGQSGWLTDAKYKQPGFKVRLPRPSAVGTCRRRLTNTGGTHPRLQCLQMPAARRGAGRCNRHTSPHPCPCPPQVLHVPDFDVGTSCVLLADCLGEIKAWSGAAPPPGLGRSGDEAPVTGCRCCRVLTLSPAC